MPLSEQIHTNLSTSKPIYQIFGNPFNYEIASTEAFRNCLRKMYCNFPGRGIGYSFQLAITAPLYSITGYCIATAQS